ncbi:hypothetical protein like AT3G48710 [Hibiscus trionum]|uniref:DEK-C domain-containing protein n=1 Tax=Hibiscus trionum TaxID=183268 RepID=A0A9W7J0G9_HIBTR|nr:hypothetical protein like AT3G48710 [Hibiscus trionum]
METETLDESKPVEEEAAPVNDKEEEESKEVLEKVVSRESEEKKEVEEKDEETMGEDEKEGDEEKEDNKEAKGSSRKRSSRKNSGDSAEKKEPVTPSSDRPTRERKVVERYSVPSAARSSTPKPLSIRKGPGTQLKDIPNVAFKLSKRKFDDNLQMLHMILFGKKAKPQRLKRNIGQFSGYVWVQNEEKQKAKVKEKIEKCVKEKLVDFCDLLNIPIMKTTVRKEEISAKLLEFLESPHATTDILLADKEQKGKKRKATSSKNIASAEASDASAKKQRSTPQDGGKHKRSSEVEEKVEDVESPVSKDDSHEDDADTTLKEVSDDEETKSKEEEEPKKSSDKSTSKKSAADRPDSKLKKTSASEKKATPTKLSRKSSGSTSKQGASDDGRTPGSKLKGSASKKQKVEKESPKDVRFSTKEKVPRKKKTTKSPAKVSTKSQGKGKIDNKPKPEPSREEIHDVVVDILKKVDFNTATLSDILRQLATHFDLDLMHRKAEVKDIITEAINNMSDDEEEGEENEENADKDGNGDDDA